ncbi:hypothetical protein ACK32N_14070 [Aeromonas caviae]
MVGGVMMLVLMVMLVSMFMAVGMTMILGIWPSGLGVGGHAVVVVMHIPLMVVVMVMMDDHRPGRTLLLCRAMGVMMTMMVAVLMMMVMPMFMEMIVMVIMLVVMVLAGNARLAASAYATHINLPRCR